MLYLFHGPDISISVKKAHALISSLRAKRPDASFEKLTADDWNSSRLESHLGGQGLFSSKYIVFLDRVSENSTAKEEVLDFAEPMKESENIFIMIEGKLLTEPKKVLEKYAEKTVVSEQKAAAASGKREFNVFALGDALGSRDAVRSWALYRQAIDSGFEPENVIGTLFWKAKMLASSASSKWTPGEVKILMKDLITIYHDSHRGLVDGELAVERLMLGVGK